MESIAFDGIRCVWATTSVNTKLRTPHIVTVRFWLFFTKTFGNLAVSVIEGPAICTYVYTI